MITFPAWHEIEDLSCLLSANSTSLVFFPIFVSQCRNRVSGYGSQIIREIMAAPFPMITGTALSDIDQRILF
jgi:hypothetical protein